MAQTDLRNAEATVYVGNLEEAVTEPLLWELMLQAGPIVNVHIPKDKVTGVPSGFGFVEFRGEEDAEYAVKIMNMVKLCGRPLRVNKKAASDRRNADIGANLFIGNLDPEVDEKLLYDTFSAFGPIVANTPKVMRDPDTGTSRGFAFIDFDSFEASDAALEAMNGQFVCGRTINVSYAFKKDSQKGERHGTMAERMLAANNKTAGIHNRPHTMFSMGPAGGGGAPPPPMNGAGPGMPPPPPGGFPPPPPGMGSQGAMGGMGGMGMGGMPPGGPPGMPPPPRGGPPGMMGGPPPGHFGGPGGPPGGFPPPPGMMMGGGPRGPHGGFQPPPGMPMPPHMQQQQFRPPGPPPGMMMPPPGMPMPPPGMPMPPPGMHGQQQGQ